MGSLTFPPESTPRKRQPLCPAAETSLALLSGSDQQAHNRQARLQAGPGPKVCVGTFPSSTPQPSNRQVLLFRRNGSQTTQVQGRPTIQFAQDCARVALQVPRPRQSRAVGHPRRSLICCPMNQLSADVFLPRSFQPPKGGRGRPLEQATLGFKSPVLPAQPIMASGRSREA